MLEDKATTEQAVFVLAREQQETLNKLFKRLASKQPSFFTDEQLLKDVSLYWVALFKNFS